MLSNNTLFWLGVVSSWYIVVPLLMVVVRWPTHDAIRRRVAWYVLFNASFTALTYSTFRVMDNIFIFYIASPIYIILVYRIYDAMISKDGFWPIVGWVLLAYCLFVGVDMLWLENFRTDFPANLYPAEKSIIIIMAYYFLYSFSKTGARDFSALCIGLAIGVNALFSLVLIVYTPYIGAEENTIGYFVWHGLGSIISIVSYSLVTYGLLIAKPVLRIEGVGTGSSISR